MGSGISSEFRSLIQERKLMKARITRGMIVKEIRAAETDLQDARDSLKQNKFKWATIQGYYSMFHSARALLYYRDYREKSHYALLVAMRELFVNELGKNLISRFEQAMDLRQEADYCLKCSEVAAVGTLEGAQEFLAKSRELLKIK